MEKVIIFCDDFRIGGIQRLSLDQAYYLKSKGIETLIVVLGERPEVKSPSFLYLEETLIRSTGLEIVFIPGSKFNQFKEISRLINGENIATAICHSLRATVLLFIARKTRKKRVRTVTTIHQLLSLSAPIQRIRRIIYSQFSDELFGYSVAVIDDWNYRRAHNPLTQMISARKKMKLCRNGVYLPRLNIVEKDFSAEQYKVQRLLFINRITAWKGLSTFLGLLSFPKFERLKMLIVTPTDSESFLIDLKPQVRARIEKVVGKSVSQINFSAGDLHLYPANYGPRSRFIEGISLNVLELASIGIRSIVTENGLSTWPDLVDLGIVTSTNWNKIGDIENAIEECQSELKFEKVMLARDLVDVRNNLLTLLAESSPEVHLKLS